MTAISMSNKMSMMLEMLGINIWPTFPICLEYLVNASVVKSRYGEIYRAIPDYKHLWLKQEANDNFISELINPNRFNSKLS